MTLRTAQQVVKQVCLPPHRFKNSKDFTEAVNTIKGQSLQAYCQKNQGLKQNM